MAAKTLLVLYYTEKGHTERMARAIAEGAQAAGVNVQCRRVEECPLEDASQADGLVVGSPTYFSNVAWPVKKFIDESIALYRGGRALGGKVGGIFTSSGTERDAHDCLMMLDKAFGFHHRMRLVPGIIAVGGESPELVRERCLDYGRRIAGELARG